MQILYEKSFYKDISKLADFSINPKILKLVEQIKSAYGINEINSIKKMSGFTDYYRIRIGDYRLGVKYVNNTVTLIRLLHRRDIYKYFP